MRYDCVKLDLFPIKKDLAFYLITRLIGAGNGGGEGLNINVCLHIQLYK